MTNFQIVKTIKSFTKETKYLLDDIYIFYTNHETTLENTSFVVELGTVDLIMLALIITSN